MSCPPQECPCCGERLIHQVNRQGRESASGFGQWVQKVLKRSFGAADVDMVVERTRNGQKLIREIEHKQPWHKFEGPQRSLLKGKAEMLRASDGFEFSDGTTLAAGSGVFVVECEVTPDIEIRGDVTVIDMATGDRKFMTPRDFALWLPSRRDERERGEKWLLREFIHMNQYETLGIEDI